MKIIHCSDLHLGASMETHLTQEQARERRVELIETFHKLLQFAQQNDVAAILIAGDLFDTSYINLRTQNLVLDYINTAQIPIFYLCGNHDENNFLQSSDTIPANLHVFSAQATTFALDNLKITGAILGNHNEAFYDNLSLNANDFNIVVLHGGDVYGNNCNLPDTVNLDKLKNKNIDYLALGHLHSFRSGKLDSRGTYAYSGCLEGRGFDETGDKGFVLLDIENNSFTSTFVPFGKRKVFELDADITGLHTFSEITGLISATLAENNVRNQDIIRVNLVGNFDENTQKYTKTLLNYFAQNYYYIELVDNTKAHINIANYTGDISIIGEFVRLVLASNFSEDEKQRILILGISALKGEETEL